MTSKLVEGDTVTLRRTVDMAFGSIPFQTMLIVRDVICDPAGGTPRWLNLERVDGSLAISALSIDSVRK